MVEQHLVIEFLCCIKSRALSSPKTYGAENLAWSFISPYILFPGNCSCQTGLGPVSPGQPFPRPNQLQGSQQSPSTEHDLQLVSSFCSGIFLGMSCSNLSSNTSTDGDGWTSQLICMQSGLVMKQLIKTCQMKLSL